MELNIDYVSDLHLTHYISKNESITKIDKLVQDKISMQVKGDILVTTVQHPPIHSQRRTMNRAFLLLCSSFYSLWGGDSNSYLFIIDYT